MRFEWERSRWWLETCTVQIFERIHKKVVRRPLARRAARKAHPEANGCT